MNKIMTLHINCTREIEVVTDRVTIRQVMFDGSADGPNFTGIIQPGAVDTQTVYANGNGRISAKYFLVGKDKTGADCKMYIENIADFGSENTTPKVVTDSKELAWLNTARLQGRMVFTDTDFMIDIYA